MCESAGYYWILKHYVIITERPSEIHLHDNQLHNDNGMAIKYAGTKWGLYMLHGTRVPEWLVMTKPEELDGEKVLKEQNAEVRSEAVRKIGYDRLLAKLHGEEIDTDTKEYWLLQFKNIFTVPMKVLKMKCPSTGEYHYIPVAPECKNVRHALDFYYKNKEYKFIEAS